MARTVSIPPIESFGRLTQPLTVQDGRAVIDLTEEAHKEARRRLEYSLNERECTDCGQDAHEGYECRECHKPLCPECHKATGECADCEDKRQW